MMGEWWKGRALDQDTHRAINARHYPGTRQLCVVCDAPTGRCEEDSLELPDGTTPVCEACRDEARAEMGGDDNG